MSRKARRYVMLIAVLGLVIVATEVIYAQAIPGTQIFGRRNVSSVRGYRVDITRGYLGPLTNPWVASPVAICTDNPCTSPQGFFETGYYFAQGYLNVYQYSSSQRVGATNFQFWVGPTSIQPLQSYNYKVLYSTSAQRWEAWLDTDVPFFRTDLNFTSGFQLSCGAEANNSNVSVSVTCNNNQYKVGNGSWTGWNYVYQYLPWIPGGYCVHNTGTYSFVAYGPTASCPKP